MDKRREIARAKTLELRADWFKKCHEKDRSAMNNNFEFKKKKVIFWRGYICTVNESVAKKDDRSSSIEG